MAKEKITNINEEMEATEVFEVDAEDEAVNVAEETGKKKNILKGAWNVGKKVLPWLLGFGAGVACGKKLGVKAADVVEVTKEVIDDVEITNF